jgi:restriction endonuclease Mrr
MRTATGLALGPFAGFFGSLDRYKATKGLFVTASTFSPSALQTAEQLSKRIVFIDGDQLTRMMIGHGVGIAMAAPGLGFVSGISLSA